MRTRAVKDGLAVLAVILGCSVGLMIKVPPIRGGDAGASTPNILNADLAASESAPDPAASTRPEAGPRMTRLR